jgi:hypothetical protein
VSRAAPAAIFVALALALALAAACAKPQRTFHDWGYSKWYHRSGVGVKGQFEGKRAYCLAREGVVGESGEVDEPKFLACMNGTGWCTRRFQCRYPG